MEVKKPATRLYTSVKMVAHELRTKFIPAWERDNTHVKLRNDYVISLILSLPAKDGKGNYLGQIDMIRGALPKFATPNPEVDINVEDLRDLVVVVDYPTLKKNKVGDHTVDQLIFDVEAYRVKKPTQPKPSKKKPKKVNGTAIVPKQLDLQGYLEELDKRVTESIRSLLEEQDAKMHEKIEEVSNKIDSVKETVDEIKEDVKETKQGLEKLHSMFGKWSEFFKSTPKAETENGNEDNVVEAPAN